MRRRSVDAIALATYKAVEGRVGRLGEPINAFVSFALAATALCCFAIRPPGFLAGHHEQRAALSATHGALYILGDFFVFKTALVANAVLGDAPKHACQRHCRIHEGLSISISKLSSVTDSSISNIGDSWPTSSSCRKLSSIIVTCSLKLSLHAAPGCDGGNRSTHRCC